MFDLSASDILNPAEPELPRLQTYEELGIADVFRTAVEAELTRDEKLVWLGRPSRNPALYPQQTPLAVIGAVLLGLAVVLAFVKIVPWFFVGACGLFGLLFLGFFFLVRFRVFNPTNTYQACYVVTNRRTMLFERGILGIDPGASNLTGTRCKSYLPHELLALERRSHPTEAGAGELIFEYIFVVGRGVGSFPGTTGTIQSANTPTRVPRGFFYLDQVREVERLIRKTLLANLEKNLDAPAVASPSANAALATAGVDIRADDCREDGEVPETLKEKMLAELDASERLVWLGQPVGALIFRRSLGYLVVGGILALVSLLCLLGGLAQKQPGPAPVAAKGAAPQAKTQSATSITNPLGFILLVASVGCGLVPLVRWKLAQGTCYALTNRRALVYKQGLFGPTRESYSPLEVAQLRRVDSWVFQEGGDVVFRSVTVISNVRGSRPSVKTTHYGFLAVAHVKEVEKLLRETLVDRFVDKLQAASAL